MKTGTIFLFFAILSSFAYGQENGPSITFDSGSDHIRYLPTWYYHFGDDVDWARHDYDDFTWESVRLAQWIPDSTGIHWYRTRIRIAAEPVVGKTLTLRFVGLYAAFEAFWDGKRIGQNGRVGKSREEEVTGALHEMIFLPKEIIQPGEHTLAIRISNQKRKPVFPHKWVILSYLSDWQSYVSRILYLHFLMIGVLIATVILSLALYFGGGKHRSFLIFGGYCLFSTASYIVTPLIEYSQFKVTALDYLFGIQYVNGLMSPIFWIVFILIHFKLARKTIHIIVTISIVVLFKLIDPLRNGVDLSIIIIVIYALVLLSYAIKQRKAGSTIAFIGVFLLTIPESIFLIYRLFHGRIPIIRAEYFVIPFIFCVTLSISRQIREENRIHGETIKRSHRLETELLKKTIQPHFIMNTLISIISLIGENPKKAIKLIKALADEFRAINRISSKNLIPVQEEIDLCRTHLDLMGHRMDADYDFVVENICDDQTIPPMIFHTLVENGLTHAYDSKESGRFQLECTEDDRQIQYRLTNDGSLLGKFSNQSETKIGEGMGLKYIRARLEESYPSRWKLTYGLNQGYWEVTITIEPK